MGTIALSETDPRMGFWFDSSKKRSFKEKSKAVARVEKFYGVDFDKIKKLSKEGSWHHLDNDRSNGHHLNLFWTTSQEQHNNIHNQLNEMASILIRSGVLGFDFVTKKYFVAKKWLEDHIRDWIAKGEPEWHTTTGHHDFPKDIHDAKSHIKEDIKRSQYTDEHLLLDEANVYDDAS